MILRSCHQGVVLAVAFLALPACLATRAETNALRRDQLELRQEMARFYDESVDARADLRVNVVGLQARLASIERGLLEMRRVGVDDGRDRERLMTEIAELKGELETIRLSQQGGAIGAQENLAQHGELSQIVLPDDAEEALRLGRQWLADGDPVKAAVIFKEIVKLHDKDAKVKAKAQMGLGDAHMARAKEVGAGDAREQQVKKAIFAYSAVLELVQGDDKAQALYRIGGAFELLERAGDARTFYREIVAKHARSPAASQAKKRLATLK